MRPFDTMFARTAWLILAVVLVLSALLYHVQRNASVLPALRTSATALAELMARDETLRAEARLEGPKAADWRDQLLAASPVWRTFSEALKSRLGSGTQLEIRGSESGPVIWAHIPGSPGWISRQVDLPRAEMRGTLLALLIGAVAAVLAGAALLARQLTGPMRRLAGFADQFAAGESPGPIPVGGPIEIRHVQQAFLRLWRSLLAAEHEREALLAGVSHDLRTPVGRMRLALGLYGDGAHPRLIEELEHDLNELEHIATQFVTYARSNSEEQSTQVVLDDLIAAVLRARIGQPAIDWIGAASQPVRLEAHNVRRVLENLIDNGLRHGKMPIQVRTEQSELDVTLIVRDAGSGIRPEDHVAALQPFVRFAAEEAPGSGLGLAIVDRIARRHGGRVSMIKAADHFEVRVTFATPPAH